jgi:transglycosylase-like protein with SLT domain
VEALSGRQYRGSVLSRGRGRRRKRSARALRFIAAGAGTIVLAAAFSLPTESAQLISALTPPTHRTAVDPRSYVGMYKAAAATCPGLPWTVVAAIGEVETQHGRLATRSRAGALGPMQFLPETWRAYATDGDHNGTADVNSASDAIATAARLLCVNGGGDRSTLATAVWNYNHSWEYVVRVLNVSAQLESARGA